MVSAAAAADAAMFPQNDGAGASVCLIYGVAAVHGGYGGARG